MQAGHAVGPRSRYPFVQDCLPMLAFTTIGAMQKTLRALLLAGTTVLATACASSSSGKNVPDASPDSAHADGPSSEAGDDGPQVTPEAGTDCGYPDADNEAGCPANYTIGFQCKPCWPVGLSCAYPGAGDGTANGCYGTAGLTCHAADSGIGGCAGDAGDAGSGYWIATQ